MTPESIDWNNDHQDWEPCPSCLLVISEVFTDPLSEDEITRLITTEWDVDVSDEIPLTSEEI